MSNIEERATFREQVKQARYEYPRVPAYEQALPKEIGEGYRLLRVGEVIPAGAEFWAFTEWCPSTIVGKTVERDHCIQRVALERLHALPETCNKIERPDCLADDVLVETDRGPMRIDPNGEWYSIFDERTGSVSKGSRVADYIGLCQHGYRYNKIQEVILRLSEPLSGEALAEHYGYDVPACLYHDAKEEVGYKILRPKVDVKQLGDQVWGGHHWGDTQQPGDAVRLCRIVRRPLRPQGATSTPNEFAEWAAELFRWVYGVPSSIAANIQQLPRHDARVVRDSLLARAQRGVATKIDFDPKVFEALQQIAAVDFSDAAARESNMRKLKELQAQLEPSGAVVPLDEPAQAVLAASLVRPDHNASESGRVVYEFKVAGRNVVVGLTPSIAGKYFAQWRSRSGELKTATVRNDPYEVHRQVVGVETSWYLEPSIETQLRHIKSVLDEQIEARAKVLPGPGTHCEWGEP